MKPSAPAVSNLSLQRGLILLVFLLPLFYIPNLQDLYRLPKVAILVALTAVLCWGWFFVLLGRVGMETPALPLLFPLGLFLFVMGFSLISAVNVFAGIHRALIQIVLLALFWISANYVRRDSMPSLFRTIVASGIIVSFLGIMQVWGIDIPTLYQYANPSSTFGNKNAAAAYILVVLPLAIYLLFSEYKHYWAGFGAAGAATTLTYLTYTWTRGVWAAAAVSSIGLLGSWLLTANAHPTGRYRTARYKWMLLAGVFFAVVLMNVVPPRFIRHWQPGWTTGASSLQERLDTFTDVHRDRSLTGRIEIWRNSINIFKDHPILGTGAGNFQFVYPLYNRSALIDTQFNERVKATETHNDYLQILIELGLPGFLIFLWILVLTGYQYWQGLKHAEWPLVSAIGFAIVGQLVNACWDFPFENPTTAAFFWIYAGLLWSIQTEARIQASRSLSKRWINGLVVGLLLLTTVAAFMSIRHVIAEFYYSRAILGQPKIQISEEKWKDVEGDLAQAVQIYPMDYRYSLANGLILLNRGKALDALKSDLQALTMNPHDVNTLNNLGVAYAAIGNMAKAIESFEKALRIWPDYVNAHNNLGLVYQKTGAKEKAILQFRESLRLDPKNEIATSRLSTLLADTNPPDTNK